MCLGETSPSRASMGNILGSFSKASWKNGFEHAPSIKSCHLSRGPRLLRGQAEKATCGSPNWLLEALRVPPNASRFIVSQADGGSRPTAGSLTGRPGTPEFLSHFGPRLHELGHVLTPSITERIKPLSSQKAKPRGIFDVCCPLGNTGAGKDGDFCTGEHSSCPAAHPRHRRSDPSVHRAPFHPPGDFLLSMYNTAFSWLF